MRYPASEKAEIIRLVEQSALPVKRTLEKLGIPRATFYRWYDLYQSGGPEASGRSLAPAGSRLEPHSGRYPRADRAAGPGRARACRRASWPCASPTRKSISCQRLRSIAC